MTTTKLTAKEIKRFLAEKGIEFPTNAKAAELQKLFEQHSQTKPVKEIALHSENQPEP